MSRNIEIKAKVNDIDYVADVAKDLTRTEGIEIAQRDTFFNVNHGRLKLRHFEDKITDPIGELIYYDRPNESGPKLSQYEKIDLNGEQFQQMKRLLTAALGVQDTVVKKRKLFLLHNTRVHLDTVENLGQFVELETALGNDRTLSEVIEELKYFMRKFNIRQNDLLKNSYLDMVATQENSTPQRSENNSKYHVQRWDVPGTLSFWAPDQGEVPISLTEKVAHPEVAKTWSDLTQHNAMIRQQIASSNSIWTTRNPFFEQLDMNRENQSWSNLASHDVLPNQRKIQPEASVFIADLGNQSIIHIPDRFDE